MRNWMSCLVASVGLGSFCLLIVVFMPPCQHAISREPLSGRAAQREDGSWSQTVETADLDAWAKVNGVEIIEKVRIPSRRFGVQTWGVKYRKLIPGAKAP